MTGNALKTPFADSLNRFTSQKTADKAQQLGQALPCSVAKVNGSIVTVNFLIMNIPGFPQFTLPQVTCPVFGPEWIRYPIQVGDLGFVVPADAYLGGVSGLGGGTADLSEPANLSALVFFPVGNQNWTPPIDPNALEFYGKPKIILHDGAGNHYRITIDSGSIEIDMPTNGVLKVTGLPTSSPGGSGKVWNNLGVLTIT